MNTIRSTFSLALGFFLIVGALDAAEPAGNLVVYEFPNDRSAAIPSYPNDKARCEATDARWIVPGEEAPPYGFGGKLGTAYVRGDAAPSAFDPEIYLTFTIKADTGYQLNLNALSFRFGATTNADYEGVEFPVFARVFSDAQSSDFSREVTLGADKSGESTVTISPVPSPDPVYTEVQAKLDESEFQNRESVTFRIHLTSPVRSSRVFLRLDDIVVRGAAVRK